MARQNQAERINALVAIVSDVIVITHDALEIYFPGSEAPRARLQQLLGMLTTLVDSRAGFPAVPQEELTNDLRS